MALEKPAPRSLEVLRPGTPRDRVVAELGTPESPMVPEEFAFEPGYGIRKRLLVAAAYAALDVYTLFLWELSAMRVESEPVIIGVAVTYDPELRVRSACVYQGSDALRGSPDAPPEC
jgi:hypothetical protein